jgi:ABC-type amino acid transport substrate-binding protein
MMVRVDDEATSLAQMNNRRVGVVLGMSSELAVDEWRQTMGLNVDVESYLTLDQAITALVAGEVDGVVEKRYRLRPLVQPDLMRVLDEPVLPEPYAIAVRRQDVNFRNLVNRTLQYLMADGRLSEIYGEFFPARLPQDAVLIWENLGDEVPVPANFATDVPFPVEYTLPRVQANGVLRVAGVPQPFPVEPEAERRIATSNAALAESLAERWGLRVEYVGTDDPLGKVERGEADLAIGVRPDWNSVDLVDFTSAYTLRGKRLMTTVRDDYTSLTDLRGQWIGVFANEPGTDALVTALGAEVNASLNVFTVLRDQDAAFEMLEENNIDAMFGDSVRLLPHVEADPETLKLSTRCEECDPWYTREYYGIAVQRNDLDFRLLVDYTLQELAQDGTLETILRPVTVRGEETLVIDVWPGPDEFMGVQFGG